MTKKEFTTLMIDSLPKGKLKKLWDIANNSGVATTDPVFQNVDFQLLREYLKGEDRKGLRWE